MKISNIILTKKKFYVVFCVCRLFFLSLFSRWQWLARKNRKKFDLCWDFYCFQQSTNWVFTFKYEKVAFEMGNSEICNDWKFLWRFSRNLLYLHSEETSKFKAFHARNLIGFGKRIDLQFFDLPTIILQFFLIFSDSSTKLTYSQKFQFFPSFSLNYYHQADPTKKRYKNHKF